MRLRMNDPGDRFFYRGQTKGLQLRLYRPGDERQVDARADFKAAFEREGSALPEGPKWSLCAGLTILAVGGFDDMGLGTWAGWAYAADLSPRQWLFAALCARACMDWMIRTEAAEIQVIGHTPAARRLMARIGFRSSRFLENLLVEAA